MSTIPEYFARRVHEARGKPGAEWLTSVPEIIEACRQQWSLRIGLPFPRLSYNYVAPAVRDDGSGAVLKVCFRDREFFTEAEALRLFAGNGAVRLLEADLGRGALLLEHLEPGNAITDLVDDSAATSAAASVLRRLWRPVPSDPAVPSVADWTRAFERLRQRFDGGSGPLPATLVDEAEQLFADLLASATEPVLLHGDLHHDNVLSAQREPWLAIDPKGVIGEPAFDTASLLYNPERLLAAPDSGRILARRIDQLADELDLDRARVRGWGIAKAVLAVVWTVEETGDIWQPPLTCAQLMANLDRTPSRRVRHGTVPLS